VNQEQALKAIAEADAASTKGDLSALRSACWKLNNLLPRPGFFTAIEQSAQPGLRPT
jgi:hypothetical protein